MCVKYCLPVPVFQFWPKLMHPAARSLCDSWATWTCIFDEHLTLSDEISALSKSCYYHIRELRCLSPYLDFKTASTIGTSIVHSKLDYCNLLYYNLPQSQIKRLQNIQNSLARAVTNTPKSSHITPVLKSLHWLKINECIKYKLLSLTYQVLTTNQHQYLHSP